MNRLQDKVAIITGTSSGIGKAAAKLFAAEGAKVVMIARRGNLQEEIAKEIIAAGGEATPFTGDITKQEDVEALFKLAIEKYGKVDIVVNNAGIAGFNYGSATVPDEDCYALFETNTMGTMRCVREALKYMLPAGKGTFVAIGSVGGLLGHGGAAYAMSKGGQVNLAKQIAVEYHLEGIRSNVICPDGVDTPLIRDENGWKAIDPHVSNACVAHACAGVPLCQPEEVANVALFLASDESVGINGRAIICDKGATL
jgi:NAD(P)-dependent dehydrogenase (short-subunit alcohol dehydrogenase family)